MSDVALTQEQIDAMIQLDRLMFFDRNLSELIPVCPHCMKGTKRMLFGSNYPTSVKVVGEGSQLILHGRIPANGIFCFGCGRFHDWVDRTPTRGQA